MAGIDPRHRWLILAGLVVAVIMIAATVIANVKAVTEKPRTLQHCRVTEKSHRRPPGAASRATTLDTRFVYTDGCGVLEASDVPLRGHNRGVEIWAELEVGRIYDLEVVGAANDATTSYPVILRYTRVG